MSNLVVGIDLGTTNTCVAVWMNQEAIIIPNNQGNRTTPSYVAFTETERLIGEQALNQAAVNAENTIFDAKRLIGRRFDDEQTQKDIRQWPFKVINDNSKPKIVVQYRGETKELSPEEVSSMILAHMKELADTYLKSEVKDAVITVPAYFNDSQRQATKDAGRIAGLNVLRVLNEPTAAALAYGLDKNITSTRNVLVFDLGGGTLDVSILTIENEGTTFKVVSTTGNTHLGGEDFDSSLVDFFVNEIKSTHDIDVSSDSRAMRRLKSAAELAKRQLTVMNEVTVMVDAIHGDIDFQMALTQSLFEDICADHFNDLLKPVKEALENACMEKEEIHEIVLVGGSTRMRKVQAMIEEFFEKKANMSINPDEAVAYGAAVHAAMQSKHTDQVIKDVELLDVTPFSLGISVRGGMMSNFIDRNTRVPHKVTKPVTPSSYNQTVVAIQVYEGERQFTKDNNLLGTFELTGIPTDTDGKPEIMVTFKLDKDSILSVSAKVSNTKIEKNIVIENNKGRLSESDKRRLVKEAEKYKEQDEAERKRMNSLINLESYIFSTKQKAKGTRSKLSDAEKTMLGALLEQTQNWLENNATVEKEQYEEKLKELKLACKNFTL